MKTKHGLIIGDILIKRGKQVVKYWKHNGYAIPKSELQFVKGVKLYTQYDGKLYAPVERFWEFGVVNKYKDEEQVVLPVELWDTI